MELGYWVTGSVGHLSQPGHRVIILTRCETRVFPVFEKMPKMQNVHLKCWNDKSHCQVSVVGLKSPDVSPCNELLLLAYLWLLKILWPENTSSHISRHSEFIIQQGHRVNWVFGSLDSRVTGSQNVTQFHLCFLAWIRYCVGKSYPRWMVIFVAEGYMSCGRGQAAKPLVALQRSRPRRSLLAPSALCSRYAALSTPSSWRCYVAGVAASLA